MKQSWRQWLHKFLVRDPRRAGSVSCRVRARPRFHPSLETLEDRTLPSGGVPFVQSINRVFPTGPTTNATSVSYAVTFNEAVTGVVASDFLVTTDGSVQAGTPVVVSGSGSAYTVAVNGIHGSGDLGLDLIDNGSIQAGGIPLGSPGGSNGSFQGQTFNILQTYPWVVSINRTNPAGPATNATAVSYTVTFSEPVTGVDPTDFQLATTGTVGSTLTQVTPVSGSVYTVTVSGITGSGTLGLNLVDDGTIRDLAGNPLVQENAPASFQNPITFAATRRPFSVVVADVNGDGKPDLVVSGPGNNSVAVLLGNGNGTFQSPTTFATGVSPDSLGLAVADVNGDGRPDLVVGHTNYPTSVSVLLGNGDGTFQSPTSFTTLGTYPASVAVADVNGDGRPDLVVENGTPFGGGTGSVGVMLGNGNGTFQQITLVNAGFKPNGLAVADLTGDGIPDLIVPSTNSRGEVEVLLGNGNGTFQRLAQFGVGYGDGVGVADLNGDGKPDLVVANPYPFPTGVSVFLGNGNGTFQSPNKFAADIGSGQSSVVITDVNGDGKLDVVVQNDFTVSVLLGNGNGTFQQATTFAAWPGGQFSPATFVAAADLTGDGRPDLVVPNPNSNTVTVLLNAANGDFTGQVYTILARPTHFLVTAPTTSTAGTPLPFFVRAEDQFNNITTGYTGTATFSSTDIGASTMLPTPTMLVSGLGTFSSTLTTAGTQTITATDAPNSVSGTSNTITVTAAATTRFVISAQSTTVAGNNMLFTVVAEDQFNNTATGYTGTVTFTSTDTGASTKLPAPSALSAGVGIFSATFTTAGNQTLTATDTVNHALSGTITVGVQKVHFFLSLPLHATAGIPFTFTVTALTATDTPAAGYSGTVTFASSDHGVSTVLPANSTLSNGVGTFTATLSGIGRQLLTVAATVNSGIPAVTAQITIRSSRGGRRR